MGIAVSILLIAVGAVLTWGVTAEAEGLDVNAIGVILLIVGMTTLYTRRLSAERDAAQRERAKAVKVSELLMGLLTSADPYAIRTPALTHGYAITGHLAQGMTCRSTFILATDELTREAAYVALSRGRDSNRIYALGPAAPERAEYAPAAGN